MHVDPIDREHSVEYFGLGQSGYTAGRIAADPSLGIEGQNSAYPPGTDERTPDLGVDERFTGVGGWAWVPRERDRSPTTR